jgi:ABC-type sugar transport system permease subunit
MLGGLGLPTPAWLLDPATALPAIMAMDVWSASGYYMIIFLAGLEAIPRDLYEAARIEGASGWTCLVRITLPLLRPTMLFVLVVNTVRSLQIFAEVFVMTRGGPLGRTTTVVYYLYEQAFSRFHLGYASAVAYLLFLLSLVLAWAQMAVGARGRRRERGVARRVLAASPSRGSSRPRDGATVHARAGAVARPTVAHDAAAVRLDDRHLAGAARR